MDSQTQYVETSGLKINVDAIGEESGQCGWEYPGAAGRCPNDSEFVTSVRWGHDRKPVPLCDRHAMEARVDE